MDIDELAEADRIVLRIAAENDGRVELEVYRNGRPVPDAQALKTQCEAMVSGGFLHRTEQFGTRSSRLCVVYCWTEAGELVVDLADRLAKAEALREPRSPHRVRAAQKRPASAGVRDARK